MELKTLYDPNNWYKYENVPTVGFNDIAGEKFVMDTINTNENALPFETHFGNMLLNLLEKRADMFVFDAHFQEPINILYTKPTKILPSLKQSFYGNVRGYLAEVNEPGKPPVVRLAGGEMLVEPHTYEWDDKTYALMGAIYALSCSAGEFNEACIRRATSLLRYREYNFEQALPVETLQAINELFKHMDFKAENSYKMKKEFKIHYPCRLVVAEFFEEFGLL